MTAKRSRKTVLEYDPLAWLKEDDDGDEELVKKVASRKKSDTKKVGQKATQKSETSKNSVVKKASKKNTTGKEEMKEEAAVIENANFGFFESEDDVSEDKLTTVDSGDSVVSLGSALTIKNVTEFKQYVEGNLADNDNLTLDPSELHKIDTAGLQLLFSLQQSMNKTGQSLSWVNKNSTIESAASLIGLPDFFDNTQSAGFGFFEDETVDKSQPQGFGFF